MTNLDAALVLARRGWFPFLLASNDKVPLIPDPDRKGGTQGYAQPETLAHFWSLGLGHGHHDGTNDPELIRAFWTWRPRANVGSRVPGHLLAVDVDQRSGDFEKLAELEEKYGPLPATLTVRTASGGEHRYFARPPGPLGHDLGGIEVKLGGTAYCVMPPSTIGDRAYTWASTVAPVALPDEYVRLLRAERRPRVSRLRRSVENDHRVARAAYWFNRNGDVGPILEHAGWQLRNADPDNGRWRRPGKYRGYSATTKKLGDITYFYAFTDAGAPFEPDQSYTPFEVKRLLEHDGNTLACVRRIERLRTR